jgi:prepilin-type N-terminal cleavage/methylation domain-containing protein
MPTTRRSASARSKDGLASFTLIELLVVIAIIAILAALTLSAASAVMEKGRRSRAASEIQAMSTALEGYKTDNGIYPQSSVLLTNSYSTTAVNTSDGPYEQSSQLIYLSLSGQTNFITANPIVGTKTYMSFKANQVGDPGGTITGATYVQDPWNYSYGYSTGTTNYPYNGTGFFDLWSTAGKGATTPSTTTLNTNAWISNWQ